MRPEDGRPRLAQSSGRNLLFASSPRQTVDLTCSRATPGGENGPVQPGDRVSDQIERWLQAKGDKTLGGLIEVFQEKAFAVIFVLLLAVPALPLPTGGATHVLEVIAMLVSLELIAGRDKVWLPQRWRRRSLGGSAQQRFVERLMRLIRRLERLSRPRGRWLLDRRPGRVLFGLIVLILSVAAFVAPPFSGLDTLPAMGAVIVSIGVLLDDVAVGIVGVLVGAAGIVLEFLLGRAAFEGIDSLLSVVGV
jgi:hypothetical protein